MNDDLLNLDIDQLPFITSDKEQKTRAIREIPGGAVIDVRSIIAISKCTNGTHGFTVYLNGGAVFPVYSDEGYRQKLINFWRFFNGV